MHDLNDPVEVNGIVVENSLIDEWPELFSNCWINIVPKSDTASTYSAELIMSDNHSQGSIIRSDVKYFPNCVSIISWTKDGNITYLWVKDEYRGSNIGYYMGVWLRTWLAVNFSIKANHLFVNERNEKVEEFLRLFKTTHNDPDIILVEEL